MNTSNRFSPASQATVFRPTMVIALLALCWIAIPATASGQEDRYDGRFKSETITDEFAIPPLSSSATPAELTQHRRRYRPQTIARKSAEDAFESALQSGSMNAAASKYLTDYLFPAMTQLDIDTLSTLGVQRANFLRSYLDEDITGQGRQQLIQLTLDRMTQYLANPELHPAVRLNATYLIGQLDSVPAIRGTQAPQPSADALQTLVSALTTEDPQRFPTFIKIAALAGIQRHAAIADEAGTQLDQGVRDQVAAELNRLLEQPTSEDPADYWLKRRAFQLGGLMGNAQTVQHMLKALKSKEEPFWLQIDALNGIAKLSVLSVQNPENDAAATTITQFVVDSLQSESKRVESKLDQLIYDNILFSDKDLVPTGSNFDGDASTGPSAGSGGGRGAGGLRGGGAPGGELGGGGMGAGGMGAGGMGAGGMGAGGMGAGGARGGRGFGGGTVAEVSTNTKVELPNYELQTVRSRIKTIAVYATNALGKDERSGLRRYLSENSQTMANKVVADLESLQRKVNLGIIDLDDRDRKEPDPEADSFTQQLADLCKQYAGDIAEHLPGQGGDTPDGLRGAPAGAASGE